MPLSDKEIRDLRPTSKRQRVSCGDSLLVVVESVGRGGGKSFVGTTRFPPGRSGKQVDVRIGVYGKGAGKWTLKAAREEWERIRDWSRETGRHPKERRRQERPRTLQDASGRHRRVPGQQTVPKGVHPHQLPQAVAEPGDRRHPCEDASLAVGVGPLLFLGLLTPVVVWS